MYLIYQKRKHFKILLLGLKYTIVFVQPSILSVPIWSVRSQNKCIRNSVKENKSLSEPLRTLIFLDTESWKGPELTLLLGYLYFTIGIAHVPPKRTVTRNTKLPSYP